MGKIAAAPQALRCRNCGDPISNGVFCGTCREMGCEEQKAGGRGLR
jgi:hypothetical protein